MSENTNPWELINQYKKAKKLAEFLHGLGVEAIDIEPTDEMRELMREAADLSTIPSRAVVMLAHVLLQEMIGFAISDFEG